MKIVLIPILFFLITSCSNSKHDEKNLVDIITKNETGLLRGIDLGVSVEDVKKVESSGITEETPDYLFYEFVIDSSNNYTIAYTFENNSLNEIRADIYVGTDSVAKNLSESFIAYFTKLYKEPETANTNMWVWPTLYKNIPIRIELSDESADYHNVGKLSLVVYKEPEMAI